ncbi:MAG TPA: deoxyribodipyrimidine photo-lyase, partial [Devosia sp.]|nr:deoxyribodipyrimidine photo-lyase [Devosia sp.]
MTGTTLVWLRNDLRIADNPALNAALERGPVIAVYVEETDARLRRRGAAS